MIKYSRLATVFKKSLNNGSIQNVRLIANEKLKLFAVRAFPISVFEFTDDMINSARYALYSLDNDTDIIFIHVFEGDAKLSHEITYANYCGKETIIVYRFWNLLTDDNLVWNLYREISKIIQVIDDNGTSEIKSLHNLFRFFAPITIIGYALCVHDPNANYGADEYLKDIDEIYKSLSKTKEINNCYNSKIAEYIIGSLKSYSITEMLDECQIFSSIKQGIKDGKINNDNMA